MAKLLNAETTIEGNGSITVQNSTPFTSGVHGIKAQGTLDVTNLTGGESISLTVDGSEVVNVSTDGTYSFEFKSKPKNVAEVIVVSYAVTNAGTADVVIDCEA